MSTRNYMKLMNRINRDQQKHDWRMIVHRAGKELPPPDWTLSVAKIDKYMKGVCDENGIDFRDVCGHGHTLNNEPKAQASVATMPNRSSEPLLTKSNTGGEEESQTDSIGDFVPLVWEIEKLRRGGNCIMNELIERVKENFKGLAGIKHRYIEYNKTPQSNTGGEQHQDKAGEELYRWVKASERLPKDDGNYFIRWKHRLTKEGEWELLYGGRTCMADPKYWEIEWLEKMPQGQSVQGSDTRGATSKDEPLPPSPPHQGEGELAAEVRRIAMAWWNGLLPISRQNLSTTYFNRSWAFLTGREIESIYHKAHPEQSHLATGTQKIVGELAAIREIIANGMVASTYNADSSDLAYDLDFTAKEILRHTHLAAQGTGSEGGK